MTVSTPLPPVDRRLTEIRHLDLPCDFIAPRTKAAWESRVRELREHILTSTGLLPAPEKCPLKARISERIERDGYSIEKVYFESLPGFFVTGNLYRPLDVSGKCPGVLNPHGHWKNGRLADEPDGSIPARCISFARQGCVAFSWDMAGYNDSSQLEHRTFGGDRERLWGLSLMGLQLWNSIRSVDFLLSLPDVDSSRIACTGESGGGTQTFLLTAVDDRIQLSAPVNMISGHMQGGCLCENAPNLRIETNNIEIAAMMAPRPMMMISATGDWTVNTPSLEFPAIREVYQLYDAEDRLDHAQIDAGHNYNVDSRNAVYPFFGKWLFGSDDVSRFVERPFTAEPPENLLVFAREPVPAHAVDAETLIRYWTRQATLQLDKIRPSDARSLRKFRQTLTPAFRSAVGAVAPERERLIETLKSRRQGDGFTAQHLYIGRAGAGDRIPATLYLPSVAPRGAALAVHADGRKGLSGDDGRTPGATLQALLRENHAVLSIDACMTGESQGGADTGRYAYPTTYNRTTVGHRVQDIVTAATYLRTCIGVAQISLIGAGDAGLWGLLACGIDPHIHRAALDMALFDNRDDEAYLSRLYIPCLRRVGGLDTAAALAAPADLLLHNIGAAFDAERIAEIYRAADAPDRLRVSKTTPSGSQIAQWAVAGPAGR
ncbi:MAG: acetylxylan esterase [candidate division Zixibacteria bacterium]|nr:acetylxylan esterase [candidate division Zixibacteria bacterium]